MKFETAHAACHGGTVHRDSNVTWKTPGGTPNEPFEVIKHESVADAKKYMKANARTKAA